MLLANPSTVKMRLVRDDVDFADEGNGAVEDPVVAQLRRERDAARAEAAELRGRAARLDGELRLAGRLQRDFLPKQLPRVGRARFAAMLRPAAHVSGDFYDVVRLDEHHVGFYVADAVGHGVPAALLTMFIKHSLATKQVIPGSGYRLLSPGETLGRLNDTLLEQGLSADTFATATYGVIDTATGRVTLARAGHPAPFVRSAAGALTRVEPDGSLLGVLPGETFAEATFTLAEGDELLLYTDGIEVAFADRPRVSVDRWSEIAAGAGAHLFDTVAAELAAYNGDAPPRDDLTVLTLSMVAA